MEDPENPGSGMAGAGDSLVKQYPPATHQFLEVPISENGIKARRWVVERTHSWLNRFRRLLIRWEKKAENYLAMLHLAFAIICFRSAGLFG